MVVVVRGWPGGGFPGRALTGPCVSPHTVTLRQLEDLKTVLQQQEEIENEKVKSDGVGDSWPDPRDSIRI